MTTAPKKNCWHRIAKQACLGRIDRQYHYHQDAKQRDSQEGAHTDRTPPTGYGGRKVVETVEVSVLPIRVAVDGGIDVALIFSKAEKKSVRPASKRKRRVDRRRRTLGHTHARATF